MPCTFQLKKGQSECIRIPSAGTMAANTLCQYDEAGEIVASATNKDVVGIVLEAATSATEPLVQLLNSGDIIEAKGVGVTIVAGTVGDTVDITTGNEITLTDTNKDALVVRRISADTCWITLKFLARATGAAKA